MLRVVSAFVDANNNNVPETIFWNPRHSPTGNMFDTFSNEQSRR